MKQLSRNNRPSRFAFLGACLSAALIATGAVHADTTVFSDDFSSDTVGNEPANVYDANGTYYPVYVTAVNDSPIGNGLGFTYGSANAIELANFSAVTLTPDNFIMFQFNGVYDNANFPPASGGPMLGLYNSEGTKQTGDGPIGSGGGSSANTAQTNDDVGFSAQKAYASGTSDFNLYSATNTALQQGANFYSFFSTTLGTQTSGLTIPQGDAFTMSLTLTLVSANDLQISSNFSDLTSAQSFTTTPISLTGSQILTTTFDELVLTDSGSGSGGGAGFYNLQVVTGAVPEPSTVALLALGLGVVLYMGRRTVKGSSFVS